MGRNRSPKQPPGKLFTAGVAALLLGAALFVVPWMFTDVAPSATALLAARIASACAGVIGIALLASHRIGRGGTDAPASRHDPAWSSQLPTDLLRRHPDGFDHTETPPITRSMETGRPPRRGQGPRGKA